MEPTADDAVLWCEYSPIFVLDATLSATFVIARLSSRKWTADQVRRWNKDIRSQISARRSHAYQLM